MASIAAQTMNGYIMFGRQLDCHVVERPHRETFKGGNREWKFVPTQVKFRNTKNNKEKTDEQMAARVRGLLEKERERRNRLKELGIEYEFSGYVRIILLKSCINELYIARNHRHSDERNSRASQGGSKGRGR